MKKRQRGSKKDVLTVGERDKSRKGDEDDVGKQTEEDVEEIIGKKAKTWKKK